MAFSKFDPHRPEPEPPRGLSGMTSGQRRGLILKYGWWISVVYTAAGFGFIAYWMVN